MFLFGFITQYFLTSGKDSLVKLWEISTSRILITYTGAGMEKQNHRTQAVFNHTEDYGKCITNLTKDDLLLAYQF